ncbi:MAG TPA: hypothetical protein VHA57_07185 [Actinomycetota bacterium]|nr:hypothetical protein [Actinomycetota bacterium]
MVEVELEKSNPAVAKFVAGYDLPVIAAIAWVSFDDVVAREQSSGIVTSWP